ncbi:MAG TPA: pyruvate carboxylase, partial [Phycisphaerae bacterium]|nr:pyruvate carboxylase [Phycisphaerae bacterium]
EDFALAEGGAGFAGGLGEFVLELGHFLDDAHAAAAAAVKIGKQVNYKNAGTVEFLVDAKTHEFYFIEVNPRIQVEHTVTEIITGIDLVKSQIRVAMGENLHESPLDIPQQKDITFRGVALQSRITSEDPASNFTPDYGRISNYRSPAGYGVRLDGGTAYTGAIITPYFDSLLVKLTCFGPTLEEVVARSLRALTEFRVRGVKTNIPFLLNLIGHPAFLAGDCNTTFIDTTPALFKFPNRKDRATRLLTYLAETIVSGNPEVKKKPDITVMTPPTQSSVLSPQHSPIPPGSRDKLKELGPKKFSQWITKQKPLLITDTTMRDAHQSLLATRVRTIDLLNSADFVARKLPNLFSLEMWGGATFDTALRFLHEDPWQRLAQLRAKIPNILFQMLFRASNALGYTNYPDNVVRDFAKLAAKNGMDIFRIFDSLNWIENMRVAMDAVLETDAICEAAICYTGDILDPARDKYSLKYYIKLAKELEKAGAHILAIKDMAGLLKPFAARTLVKALKEEISIPIHFHTHDTAGVQAASYLMASEAGVDIVDCAVSSMSGMTSQPNLNSLAAALENTPRETGLDRQNLQDLSDYWEAVRRYYGPFEEGMLASTASVYDHEMPGGQYTNLRVQAKSLGLESRWNEIAQAYADVNKLFGDIVKVTPSSKIVGDMALFMVTNNLKPADVLDDKRHLAFPKSVVEFFRGDIGQPPGGFPKELQKIVLGKDKPLTTRPGAKLAKVDMAKAKEEAEAKVKHELSETDFASYLMYPAVFAEFARYRAAFGDVSVIPTTAFFYGLQPYQELNVEIEPGKTLLIRFLTTGDTDADGNVTVFFELNGAPREIKVIDRRKGAPTRAAHPKADRDNPKHIAAPMPGKVTAVNVSLGQSIAKGARLL